MSKLKSIALSFTIAAVSTVGVSQTAHADSGYEAGHNAGWLWYQILRLDRSANDAWNDCVDLAWQQSGDDYQLGFYEGCNDAVWHYG